MFFHAQYDPTGSRPGAGTLLLDVHLAGFTHSGGLHQRRPALFMEVLEMRLDAFSEKIMLRFCGVTEFCHVSGAPMTVAYCAKAEGIGSSSNNAKVNFLAMWPPKSGVAISAWRDRCTTRSDAVNSRAGTTAGQLGARSMTEKLRESPFHCPHCAAKYAPVKVEALSPVDAKVRCISCGGPLDGRENAFILKYFLVERPRHEHTRSVP